MLLSVYYIFRDSIQNLDPSPLTILDINNAATVWQQTKVVVHTEPS